MMHHPSFSFKHFVAKVIILTIIFSMLGFIFFPHSSPHHYKADHVHDEIIIPGQVDNFRQDTTINQDEVDKALEQAIQEIFGSDTHGAALAVNNAEQLYSKLCGVYTDICNKVSREGEYTITEKLTYQLLIIYLINQIDQRLTIGTTLRETLSHLKLYHHDEDRRGSAGHTYVKMNIAKIGTPKEFREVLTHEFGHIIDLGLIQGNATQKDPTYTEFGIAQRAIDDPSLAFYEISRTNENVRKSSASYKDFVSGYAMKGVYEEFAESKNLRFNHHDLFVQLAAENPILQQKYNYFDALYGGKYFKTNSDQLHEIINEKRPWDTTKLWIQ